jgi:hypothetical protein
MLTLIAATATFSGLIAGLLPAIQIAKMLRTRCSKGISLPYLAGGVVNNLIWTVYGLALPSLALTLPAALGLLMNAAMLTVAVRYRPGTAANLPTPLVAHVATAVVHDEELAAEFAELLAEGRAQRVAA